MPSDFAEAWNLFEPSPPIGLAEYSVRSIFNEESKPFDFLAFPHMVACGGPMDAFDDAEIREIVEQMASRLGKTFLILCGAVYLADLAPCGMILAGNNESLGLQQTERVKIMALQVPSIASTTLERTQKKQLRFGGNIVYAAWSRSPVTLSNINARFGGASELDLWEHVSTSKHPDPESMFGDRFKNEDAHRKVIYESIPTLKGTYLDKHEKERPRSRIEAKLLKGSNCRLWVGCPFCGGRQVLVASRITRAGYDCEHCDELIPDERRKEFIRSGVWAPEGCTVDPDKASVAASRRLELLGMASALPEGHDDLPALRDELRWRGWRNCDYIIGTPTRDNEIASYQLSSFYALSLTWGRIAEQDQKSQNFINQWAGETMEVDENEYDLVGEATQLAQDITGTVERGKLPPNTAYLVLISDRQMRSLPWQIQAWNSDLTMMHVVDAGVALEFADLDKLAECKIENRRLSCIVLDSGYLPKDSYEWCLATQKRTGIKCYPVKGDKANNVGNHYKLKAIEDEQGFRAKYRPIKRMHINTQSTQEWVNELLADRQSIRLWNAKAGQHQALCEEFLNEHEVAIQVSRRWERRDTQKPNDQRDNIRYGFCGAQHAKAKNLGVVRRTMAAPKVTAAKQTFQGVGPSQRPILGPNGGN